MFDEHSLQLLNEVLKAVAAVVAIIGGTVVTLYHLRKLAPGWHRNVFPLATALRVRPRTSSGITEFSQHEAD